MFSQGKLERPYKLICLSCRAIVLMSGKRYSVTSPAMNRQKPIRSLNQSDVTLITVTVEEISKDTDEISNFLLQNLEEKRILNKVAWIFRSAS